MKASIDIGTNTVLLLVAETQNSRVKTVRETQRIPRLGAGVDESKNLSAVAISRVINALNDFRKIIHNEYPTVSEITVTATSAVRDAKNRDEFRKFVKEETGLTVNVLSGLEEARYTFQGAASMLPQRDLRTKNVVIDIGGGSTEIATGGEKLKDRYSYDMGCVRFTERFLKADPPTEDQINRCREAIQSLLDEHKFDFTDGASLIGVAGTVTSLAFIDKKLESYRSEKLNGHRISFRTLENYVREFKKLSSEKLRANYPAVMEGRADIFLAGLLILEEFMLKYKVEGLVVSTGGIRHGVLL